MKTINSIRQNVENYEIKRYNYLDKGRIGDPYVFPRAQNKTDRQKSNRALKQNT